MSLDVTPLSPLAHGGRLRRAAQDYHIPLRHWLDLSTGINPLGWPVPPVPEEVWRRLPEEEDGLLMASTAFFGHTRSLAVAGSQMAIRALPQLRAAGQVGVLGHTYAEHAHAWHAAGHRVRTLLLDEVDAALDTLDVLIVVNPDNPTGSLIEPAMLAHWHHRLSLRGAWLIVDEAFIDATPRESMAAAADEHLIVLRSLGKFWGLAGVRAGFVLAAPRILDALRDWLGPWAISHPARWVAQRALADRAWQQTASERLSADSARLAKLLAAHGLHSPSGTALFRWVPTPRADELFEACARRALLLRAFPQGLRIGLPGSEADWQKLEQVLVEVLR